MITCSKPTSPWRPWPASPKSGKHWTPRPTISPGRGWARPGLHARDSRTSSRPYDRLEGMSTQPERITLTTPMTALAETKVRHADGTETDLPTRTLHVTAAEDGTYPY